MFFNKLKLMIISFLIINTHILIWYITVNSTVPISIAINSMTDNQEDKKSLHTDIASKQNYNNKNYTGLWKRSSCSSDSCYC